MPAADAVTMGNSNTGKQLMTDANIVDCVSLTFGLTIKATPDDSMTGT